MITLSQIHKKASVVYLQIRIYKVYHIGSISGTLLSICSIDYGHKEGKFSNILKLEILMPLVRSWLPALPDNNDARLFKVNAWSMRSLWS